MKQTKATLEHLAAIGQEITSHLEAASVFQAMDRHVHGLLDADSFIVYLLDADGAHLTLAFGIEANHSLPPARIALSNPLSHTARCLRERREIMINQHPDVDDLHQLPGTLPTLNMLFAPLTICERALGVMTIQSIKSHAYGDRERLIFRTLCAYGAIALDNMRACHELTAALTMLREMVYEKPEFDHAYRTRKQVSITDPLTGLQNFTQPESALQTVQDGDALLVNSMRLGSPK